MNDSQRFDFGRLVSQALAYYGKESTPFILDAWWHALNALELEQVQAAVRAHVMDPDRGSFPIMLADVTRLLAGTSSDAALVAWAQVYGAVREHGAYSSVEFGDPIVHAAITDIGGWVALCQSKVDELPHLQRRFCDSYRAQRRRAAAQGLEALDAPAHLPGVHELELAGTKWQESHTPAPARVGFDRVGPGLLGRLTSSARGAVASGPRQVAALLEGVPQRAGE